MVFCRDVSGKSNTILFHNWFVFLAAYCLLVNVTKRSVVTLIYAENLLWHNKGYYDLICYLPGMSVECYQGCPYCFYPHNCRDRFWQLAFQASIYCNFGYLGSLPFWLSWKIILAGIFKTIKIRRRIVLQPRGLIDVNQYLSGSARSADWAVEIFYNEVFTLRSHW